MGVVSCPCCGAALPEADERILVAEDVGLVVANGAMANLTPAEMGVMVALRDAAPRVLTKVQLLAATSQDVTGNDEREIKIVDVFVCKLRKKLKPLGVEIATAWGQGYRLVVKQGEFS